MQAVTKVEGGAVTVHWDDGMDTVVAYDEATQRDTDMIHVVLYPKKRQQKETHP